MLLKNKNAMIYGAGGAVGSAVARAFAREGARVFPSGRKLAAIDAAAKDIIVAGGAAKSAEVDALDELAVQKHTDEIARKAGSIDISFNVISIPHVQGKSLVEQGVDDFALPVMNFARTHFLTATAAARHMAEKKSGVIMMMSAPPGRVGRPLVGAFGAACATIEAFARTLAAEVGPRGIRVVCLPSSGSPGKTDAGRNFERHAKAAGLTLEQLQAKLSEGTMLRRLTMLEGGSGYGGFRGI